MSSPFIIIDEITTKINEINSSLTTKIDTIDNVVDTINSNVSTIKNNVATILTNTNTNNTASTTGTLSQKISSAISNTAATTTENVSGTLSAKLTYLINRRDKTVTPSATNLKTLNSSGSVSVGGKWGDANQTTLTANGSTYTCYAKYNGLYRGYFTCSMTWQNYAETLVVGKYVGNNQTGTVTGVVKVFHISSGSTTEHTVKIVEAQQAAASSTTKTVDFPAQVGDRIQMFVKISETSNVYDSCSSANSRPYIFDIFTANWTNISVRGTVNEINGATT